jgi:hypothetical protein
MLSCGVFTNDENPPNYIKLLLGVFTLLLLIPVLSTDILDYWLNPLLLIWLLLPPWLS